jgi:glycosyltransferase involved in cell wall biosynthesis
LHPAVDDAIAAGYDAVTPTEPPAADGGRNYLVAIVSDEPRKNAAALMEAMAFLPSDIGLKIVGALHPSTLTAQAAAERARIDGPGRVELLGYLDDARKRAVLAGALGVVVPSLSEGFGIPLVEGLFFGKPVFCSDIPVFREVAGDGVFYFDPGSPQSIAAAVRAYLESPEAFRARVAAVAVAARARFALSALERAVEARFGRAVAVAR